jgi:phosphoserine phosphatase
MSVEKSPVVTKLAFFDLDGVIYDVGDCNETGTKVGKSAWNVLFDYLGILGEHNRLKHLYTSGYFPSYMDWTDEACRVLQGKGLTEQALDDCFASRQFMPGVKETFKELHQRGYHMAIISGSLKYLADQAAQELDIDRVIAHCELFFDPSGKLDNWHLTPSDYEDKAVYFHRIARDFGLRSDQCAYIGDEVNDISLFHEAGLSVAFNSRKPSVSEAAQIVIDKPDLREILPYLK